MLWENDKVQGSRWLTRHQQISGPSFVTRLTLLSFVMTLLLSTGDDVGRALVTWPADWYSALSLSWSPHITQPSLWSPLCSLCRQSVDWELRASQVRGASGGAWPECEDRPGTAGTGCSLLSVTQCTRGQAVSRPARAPPLPWSGHMCHVSPSHHHQGP